MGLPAAAGAADPVLTPSPSPGADSGDTTAPDGILSFYLRSLRGLEKKGVSPRLICNEACDYRVQLFVNGRLHATRTGTLAQPGHVVLKLTVPKKSQRAVDRLKRGTVTVIATLSDAAGNRAAIQAYRIVPH